MGSVVWVEGKGDPGPPLCSEGRASDTGRPPGKMGELVRGFRGPFWLRTKPMRGPFRPGLLKPTGQLRPGPPAPGGFVRSCLLEVGS